MSSSTVLKYAFCTFILFLSAQGVASTNSKYFDEDGCLSEELYKEALQEFTFKHLNPKLDLCHPEDAQVKTLKAVTMLKNASYSPSSPSPKMTFTNDLSHIKTPYAFLKERVYTIHFIPCKGGLMEDALAYVVYYHRNTMFICDDVPPGHSAAQYMDVLVHESRHLDGNDLGHDTCSHGLMKGLAAGCDATFKQKGAYFYGAQTEMLIAKYGQNFHPVTKYRAALSAAIAVENKFNENHTVEINKSVILREIGSNQMWSLDSEQKLTRLDLKVPGAILEFNRGYYASYNPSTGLFHRYDILNGDAEKEFDLAEKKYEGMETWYVRKPISERPALKAIGKGGEQFLYENKLDYALGTNAEMFYSKIGTLTLPSNDFTRIVPYDLCKTKLKKEDVVFLETKNREGYVVTLDQKLNPRIERTNECELNYLAGATLNEQALRLSYDGQLLVEGGGKYTPVESAKEKRFDFLSQETKALDFLIKKTE